VIAVVTPDEMAAIDEAAPEPADVLIERAGAAVARAARSMLGGTYGRVVTVIAGKGNNGNDGRVAARRLADDGVVVRLVDATACPSVLPACDLVVDAAYGTGFRPRSDGATWKAPAPAGAPVLAVDIPSGVDGLTGAASGAPLAAERTVTFAALKPGLLYGDGARLAGRVDVADIGLDVARATVHRLEAGDVGGWWRPRERDDHKWKRAVRVVAGSPGMTGAADLCSAAAMRAGAGIVWLSSPGAGATTGVTEVVGHELPAAGWATAALDDLERFGSLVVGPGLGRAPTTAADVVALLAASDVPAIIDGDGLAALAASPAGREAVRSRRGPVVLTPHDGEFRALAGGAPGPDRIAAARRLATEWACIVLLKGPTTTVAAPDGRVRVVTEGDARLATAGTGDVLSGVIGALLASGIDAADAAAAGAWIHGAAGRRRPVDGLVASDLLGSIPEVLAALP
jgi:ADP-dependent NAD(P)H-hydrate dehydratase / NAD(P)H-hydrate epimerase